MPTQSTSTSTHDLPEDRIVIPLSTDERCWFKCRQSNAGRLRGQEPSCSIFCYYSNQLPSLIKNPTEMLKSTRPTRTSSSALPDHLIPQNRTSTTEIQVDEIREPLESRWDELLSKYTIKSLEGKFLYFATGKPAITRHLSSMSRLGSVEHDWLVQKLKENQSIHPQQIHSHDTPEKSMPVTRKELPDKSYRGMMVLAYPKDSEHVINVAHSIATGLASIHGHFEKIYGPGYRIISKIPKSISEFRDQECDKVPSQFTLIYNLFNRPLLSDSINLLNRSFESVSEVMGRLATKYASNLEDRKNTKPSDRNKPPPSS